MNRLKYWVVEPKETTITIGSDGLESIRFPYDAILAELVLAPDEIPEWPPAIRFGIEHKGWRVISRELPSSGLNDMAWVDWKALATKLFEALDGVLQEEEGEEDAVEAAGVAMDDYRIALTEEAMRVQGEPLPRDDRDSG